MTTINFVPNDYIQQRKSSRANLLYLVLLAVLLGGIGVTFSIIKMRQAAAKVELDQLDGRMVQAREQIARLEKIKSQGKTMVKSMMMTAELLEPAPRSVVLACLTNLLPSGVSLLNLRFQEKETKVTIPVAAASGKAPAAVNPAAKPTQYQAAATNVPKTSKPSAPEVRTVLNNEMEIEGIAHSDIEVASYIANLSGSILLDNVQLVESKEKFVDGITYRQFRLRASLKTNLQLTKDDIEGIRKKREQDS